MHLRALAILAVVAPLAAAQDTTSTAKLPPMVTVTRQPAVSPFDLPFGISTVIPDSSRPGQPHVSADQTLAMIPGLTVANRTNPSQDVRLSIRGFGARSAFGVRSIRVLRDGMPLTLPDGQTPLDYLDLESIGTIEVIRGTAAALYGNASGGVIDLHSVTPMRGFAPEVRSWLGSDALRRTTLVASDATDRFTFQGNVGQTQSDNYRQFSHQRLTNGFGRVTTTLGGWDLSLVGLGLHMPVAENPGALTKAQFDTNPEMADPASITKKARKEVDQSQVGLTGTRAIGRSVWTASVYGGTRSLYNPLAFAVVNVDRTIGGASIRGDVPVAAIDGLQLTVGGDYQSQNDDRQNWANCNGVSTPTASCTTVGTEKGVLQLDQREIVTGGGPYARAELTRGRFRFSGGARYDAIRFEAKDAFLSNGDDSGVRTLSALSPMVGVNFRLDRLTSLYYSLSTAFETPTTTELGNQADGSAGFNPTLQPQKSSTGEIGVKGLWSRVAYQASVFHTGVTNELITYTAANGRNYFLNAGATDRDGLELSMDASVGPAQVGVAYSYSSFQFKDYVSGGTQLAGNAIPGIPLNQLQASVLYRMLVAEAAYKSRVYGNDANSMWADGYAVLNLRATPAFDSGPLRVQLTAGVNNVTDARYAGSLALNAAGTIATAKLYEPSPGRTWIAGATVRYKR